MSLRKIFFNFLIISILLTTKIFAQGEAAVPFLLLAPDSRAGGIGESGSGLADNSAAIFWNPAGIAFLTGSEVSLTHSNWLPQFHLDLFYDYATFRMYMKELRGSLTASITYMNFGEFIRTGENDATEIGRFRSFDAALTVGYATKLSPAWGIGGNFRVIHSSLSDAGAGQEKGSGKATTISFDIATMWRPESLLPKTFIGDILNNKFSVGVNISNLGPKIYYIDQAQADPIPTNFRLGLAYNIFDIDYNSLTATFDLSKLLVKKNQDGTSDEFYKALLSSWTYRPVFREMVYSGGLEYVYGMPGDFQFALRAGAFYEDPEYGNRKFVTFGAGIKYDMYAFDFSYITTTVFPGGENHPLSETLRFSLAINWDQVVKKGGKGQPVKGLPRGI